MFIRLLRLRHAVAAFSTVGLGLFAALSSASAHPTSATAVLDERPCATRLALAERIVSWARAGRGEASSRSGKIIPHWLAAFEQVPGGRSIEADTIIVFVTSKPRPLLEETYPEGSAYLAFIKHGCLVADGWVAPRALNYVEVEAAVTLEGGEASPLLSSGSDKE